MNNEKTEFINKFSVNAGMYLAHCGWEKCKKSHSFGPAVRPHYLLHYILSGEGKYYVNNQCHTVKSGEAFLIIPEESTIYVADDKNPWTYCWIGFNGNEAKTLLNNCGLSRNNLIVKLENPEDFEKDVFRLIDSFGESSSNHYTLIGNLYLCFSHLIKQSLIPSKSHSKTYIDKATTYVYNNYSYDIKISDIAKFIGIDRTYLYKIFQEENKISPQQFLINYRLNISANMLSNTDLNITQIAYSCGFKDLSSYYKHFKNYYRTTPLHYKKNPVIVVNK